MSEDLAELVLSAQSLLGQGRIVEGCDALRAVIAQQPDYPGAQALLSRAVFPGPHYREVLKEIHSRLHPQTYLEIGVESGATLAFAARCEIAVGVDPEPLPSVDALPSSLQIFRETSDDFFTRHSRSSVFGERNLDLAFIDGAHHFEQALRDFIHVEAWSSPNTVVLLHDCLPISEIAAEPQRTSKFWVGDVWKLLNVLLEHRPDLAISVIPAAPSGLVVVRGLGAQSKLLSERTPEILQTYAERPYPHRYGEWSGVYDLVENSRAGIDRVFPAKDGYLFSKEVVRFELKPEDILATPAQLQLSSTGRTVQLRVGTVQVDVDTAQASLEQCQQIMRRIDGQHTLATIAADPDVDPNALQALLHEAFGVVIFAPFAVTDLERQLSGIEIVRFPGSPYEIVRSYWENQIAVARAIEHSIERLCDPEQFLPQLKQLHVTLLRGSNQQSIYTPASPIASKGVRPGELLDNPARFAETPSGPVLVQGAKVTAALLGGESYQRVVCDSVGDPDALNSDRPVVGEDGLEWGRLVTARAGQDPDQSPLFIPPRPFQDRYFHTLAQSLALAWQAAEVGDSGLVVRPLARFHQRFVRLHPFQCANQSLAMALVNFVLRRSHGAGIPHLVLDHFALRLNETSYAALLARAVSNYSVVDVSLAQRYQILRQRKTDSYALISKLASLESPVEAAELIASDEQGARAALLSD